MSRSTCTTCTCRARGVTRATHNASFRSLPNFTAKHLSAAVKATRRKGCFTEGSALSPLHRCCAGSIWRLKMLKKLKNHPDDFLRGARTCWRSCGLWVQGLCPDKRPDSPARFISTNRKPQGVETRANRRRALLITCSKPL